MQVGYLMKINVFMTHQFLIPNDGQRYYWNEEAHQADNTTGWETSDTAS